MYAIIGAILGNLLCVLIAITLGKVAAKYMPKKYMKIIAGVVFFIFGVLTLLALIFNIDL